MLEEQPNEATEAKTYDSEAHNGYMNPNQFAQQE